MSITCSLVESLFTDSPLVLLVLASHVLFAGLLTRICASYERLGFLPGDIVSRSPRIYSSHTIFVSCLLFNSLVLASHELLSAFLHLSSQSSGAVSDGRFVVTLILPNIRLLLARTHTIFDSLYFCCWWC